MKRCHILAPSLFLGALLLGGCTVVGNESLGDQSIESLHQKITEGRTTQSEVQAALGSPNTVLDQDSGETIWIYRYSRAKPWASDFIPFARLVYGRQDVQTREMVLNFDRSRIVTKFSLREITDVARHGMFE